MSFQKFDSGMPFGNLSFKLTSLSQLKSQIDTAGVVAVQRGRNRMMSGTTVLAMKYKDGVVMAGDRRLTDLHCHWDDSSKVEVVGEKTLIACAGAVAYIQDLIEVLVSLRKQIEGEIEQTIYIDGTSNLLKNILKANFESLGMLMYMLDYIAVPILAGYDPVIKSGRLFSFDENGGMYERQDFVTMGSGGSIAQTVLDDAWGPKMSEEESVTLAVRALVRASRDNYTAPPMQAPVIVMRASADGISLLEEEKALLLAWRTHLKDLKRRGDKIKLNYFLGKTKEKP